MFGDFTQKIKEAQAKAEAAKQRLSMIEVKGDAAGKVEVYMTGNRELRKIQMNIDHKVYSKEALEDLIAIAFSDAIQKANAVYEAEMGALAREAMPSIPGLGNMFKK
jgi:DNA-binding protein YbaB